MAAQEIQPVGKICYSSRHLVITILYKAYTLLSSTFSSHKLSFIFLYQLKFYVNLSVSLVSPYLAQFTLILLRLITLSVQFVSGLVMQVLQFASYLLHLESASPRHFVLKHPQSLLLPQTKRPSFMPK